ncbi:MAG: DM13 domain-containing protein [Cohaesibacteraceae bacterium]|nr:DM13 domain-containing protein [Cohaesibacteraceae bacterium]MBL4875259.1 DM13 domain-containing protein [Cohaesibacteraceae bacterium]
MRILVLLVSHGVTLALGFALGVYFLPILIAPPAPEASLLQQIEQNALYTATIKENLKGSDTLHWGEGTFHINTDKVAFTGTLAPGPDYRVYLVPEFVETEAQFLDIKSGSQYLGDVKSFDGFIVSIATTVQLKNYTTIIVWCETFGEFITAAKFR